MICFMMNLSRKHIWENKEEIDMDQVVITIARQYGSGGRTVGKMLAERLGISFYDKQIIQMASDESGIDVKLFGKVEAGDKSQRVLFSEIKKAFTKVGCISREARISSLMKTCFNYQAKVVNDLAEKESCVIVGRCVNYVFQRSVRIHYAYSSMRPGNFVWRRLLRRFPDQERMSRNSFSKMISANRITTVSLRAVSGTMRQTMISV